MWLKLKNYYEDGSCRLINFNYIKDITVNYDFKHKYSNDDTTTNFINIYLERYNLNDERIEIYSSEDKEECKKVYEFILNNLYDDTIIDIEEISRGDEI